jgi:hypothetical protein
LTRKRKSSESTPKKSARREPKSAAATTQRFDALADAVIRGSEMDETAAYMRRGRVFSSLAVDALNLRWIEAFKRYFVSRDSESRRVFVDLGAELRLRGLEPAFDAVKPELDAIQAEIAANGPDNPGIRDAIRKFFEARNKPQA